jgi:hypothetical protein
MSMINQHKRMAMGKRFAEGGSNPPAPPPPPPQLGGMSGDAQKKLSGRQRQLEEQEAQALGKKRGGSIKKGK